MAKTQKPVITSSTIFITSTLLDSLPEETYLSFSKHVKQIGVISEFSLDRHQWMIYHKDIETSLSAASNVVLETLVMFMQMQAPPQAPTNQTQTIGKDMPRIHLI